MVVRSPLQYLRVFGAFENTGGGRGEGDQRTEDDLKRRITLKRRVLKKQKKGRGGHLNELAERESCTKRFSFFFLCLCLFNYRLGNKKPLVMNVGDRGDRGTEGKAIIKEKRGNNLNVT